MPLELISWTCTPFCT